MFIAIAVFMGDGIYNLLKTIYLSVEVRTPSGHGPPSKCTCYTTCTQLEHVVADTQLLCGFLSA